MLYDCFLTLSGTDFGEIRCIPDVKLISWTRSRVIITNEDDESELFSSGQIVKCTLIKKGENNK